MTSREVCDTSEDAGAPRLRLEPFRF